MYTNETLILVMILVYYRTFTSVHLISRDLISDLSGRTLRGAVHIPRVTKPIHYSCQETGPTTAPYRDIIQWVTLIADQSACTVACECTATGRPAATSVPITAHTGHPAAMSVPITAPTGHLAATSVPSTAPTGRPAATSVPRTAPTGRGHVGAQYGAHCPCGSPAVASGARMAA